MPVRIFFRGLVLFQFRKTEQKTHRLVALLVSDPGTWPGQGAQPGGPPGQNDHEAEMHVVTGASANQLVPRPLRYGARIDITIPGADGVVRSPSFSRYVPKLSQLAKTSTPLVKRKPAPGDPLPPNPEPGDELLDWRYIRNKITVNRGTVRVKDLVIWDGAGYPLPDTAADGALGTPADIKFLGVDVRGQFANTCVVEVPDTDIVDIESPDHPELDGAFRSVRRRNQRAQSNTTDILITNYEYQRERPVPWGLDYQWLFAAARYGTADLDPAELERFDDMGRRYAPGLHKADRDSLLPTNNGRPFPYIVSAGSPARSALTDIDSRPVCIPGDDNGDG